MQRMTLVSVLLKRSVNINWMILAHEYPHIMLARMSKERPKITCNSRKKKIRKKKKKLNYNFHFFHWWHLGLCTSVCFWDFEWDLVLQQVGVPHESLAKQRLWGYYFPYSLQFEIHLSRDSRLQRPQKPGREHKCGKSVTNGRVNVWPKDIQIRIFYKLCLGQANHVQGRHQPAVHLWPLPPAQGHLGNGEEKFSIVPITGGNTGSNEQVSGNTKGSPK